MNNNRSNGFAWLIAAFALGFGMTVSAQDRLLSTNDANSSLHANLPTLTRVQQVRELSFEQARRHYPVKLRVVVLDYSKFRSRMLFVSDSTGGIFVRMPEDKRLAPGQLVEISGVSEAGGFAPVIALDTMRVVGTAELPPPRDVPFEKIASGGEDSQWVKVTGIIRTSTVQNIRQNRRGAMTLVTADGGRLNVIIDDYQGEPMQPLIDAKVAVTGVVQSIKNRKRQLISARLIVPGVKFLKVLSAAPRDTLTMPPRSIGSLRQFSPDEAFGHRIKVQGVVTLQQPGDCIYIQDETGSIRVETRQTDTLSPGDRVEALGFPAIGGYTPVLQDAIFHETGTGPPPDALELSAKEARPWDHDAELIATDAQLLNQFRTPDHLILILQRNDTTFRAQLDESHGFDPRLRNGSRLRLTGVCLAQMEGNHPLQTFQMILRSPADVVVLSEPSWWTPRRLRWAVFILTGVLLGAGIWVWTLKREVRIQTKSIHDKIEREAVLQERMRIAREFHDSLEQELTGVRMQLELSAATAAHAPETAMASLQMAKTMICHSQAEARRSVWELRSQILENRTLPAALSAAFCKINGGPPIQVNVSGQTRPLPMRVESNLLRIAQEAIANAIKHARPNHVACNLIYEANGARLNVCDDGCGFSVENAPDGQGGHFGLLGMKERADKIAGTLRITSRPGKGTCVEVFVPEKQETTQGVSD